MSPPELTTVSASTANIITGPSLHLGPNATVSNSATSGVNIGSLQLKTQSTVSSQGLNINPSGSTSSLTIDKNGDINTAGYISANGDLSIGPSSQFTVAASSGNVNTSGNVSVSGNVSALGTLSANGNLTIGSGSQFTVASASGNVHTSGTFASDGNLTVNTNKFTVASSSGNVTTAGTLSATGDLTVNSNKFQVASTSGNVSTAGTLSAAGDFAVNTNKFTVASSTGNVATSGTLSATGDFAVNTSKFTVASSSGNVSTLGNISAAGTLSATGDLAINTNKFNVAASSGNVSTAGNVSIAGTLSSTNDFAVNTNKFQVASSSGNVSAAGSLYSAGNLTVGSGGQFVVTATSGNVSAAGTLASVGDFSVNTNKFHVSATDGTTTSAIAYSTYVPPASSTNTTTTSVSGATPALTSSTSSYLTTQEYVDKQIWNQAVRINTILGTDAGVVDNFNTIFKLLSTIEGTDTLVAIGNNVNGLVTSQSQILTSVSEVVQQAVNTVLVNCTPTVWQDECGPMPIPNTITSLSIEDGWYFSNLVAGEKINWYLPINGSNMTVGSIQNLYLNVFANSNVSLPIITVYTAPKGDGNDLFPGWAAARINYVFSPASTSITSNTSYCLYTGEQPMNVYNKTQLGNPTVVTTNGTNKNNNGKNNNSGGSVGSSIDNTIVSASDKIISISINTDSTTGVGNVSMVVNSFNISLLSGTTQFTFSNAGVMSNYLFNYFFSKNADFTPFPTPAKQATLYSQYNTQYNSN